MFGVKPNAFLDNMHFTLFFIRVNLTFLPIHFLGLNGMPQHIYNYPVTFNF